jgi:hypothetical protein
MKKIILTVLFVILFGLISFSMLYNGFSGVKSMTLQTYDESFDEVQPVKDPEVISTVTGILNRSNKITRTHFKIATEPTYKLKLVDQEREEILYLHEGFDKDETLITGDNREHYYKMNQKQTDKIVQLLSK